MNARINSELIRGSLDLMILSVLADSPKYGYLLQQSLRHASREMIDLKAGTLYPLLHRLENEKLIRSRWDADSGRKRKWYELTARGRKQLETQAREWNEYADCIRRLLAPVTRLSPGAT